MCEDYDFDGDVMARGADEFGMDPCDPGTYPPYDSDVLGDWH
jgi:hypothetical protein